MYIDCKICNNIFILFFSDGICPEREHRRLSGSHWWIWQRDKHGEKRLTAEHWNVFRVLEVPQGGRQLKYNVMARDGQYFKWISNTYYVHLVFVYLIYLKYII